MRWRLEGPTHLGASVEIDAALRFPHDEMTLSKSRDLAVSDISIRFKKLRVYEISIPCENARWAA